MNVDVGNAVYTAGMIILAFVTALVVTKTISKYVNKEEPKEK